MGRKLVDACWGSAADLEIKTVFTLTYVTEFFERCGFHQIEKAELPHKIWNECVRCPLFPNCTEIALTSRTTEAAPTLANGILAAVDGLRGWTASRDCRTRHLRSSDRVTPLTP